MCNYKMWVNLGVVGLTSIPLLRTDDNTLHWITTISAGSGEPASVHGPGENCRPFVSMTDVLYKLHDTARLSVLCSGKNFGTFSSVSEQLVGKYTLWVSIDQNRESEQLRRFKQQQENHLNTTPCFQEGQHHPLRAQKNQSTAVTVPRSVARGVLRTPKMTPFNPKHRTNGKCCEFKQMNFLASAFKLYLLS